MNKIQEALSQNRPLDDPLILKEYDPPMLRFENGTLEDRVASDEAGEYRPKNAVFVHVRAWGDIKNEVPYIVKTTVQVPRETDIIVRKNVPVQVVFVDADGNKHRKVEHEEQDVLEKEITYHPEEIFPWFTTLQHKVRHAQLPQAYLEHCKNAYEQWEKHGEVALDGFPVDDWKVASPAQIEVLKSVGINTVERVSDMSEDAIEGVGMGARELKKKAKEWLLAGKDQNAVVAKIAKLESDASAQQTAYEAKIAELEAMISSIKETEVESAEEETEVTE